MRYFKIRCAILLAALVIVPLTAVPAVAGKVSIMNTNDYNAYYVQVKTYYFGVLTTQGKCIPHGKSKTFDDVIGAVSYIAVYHTENNTCSSDKHLTETIKDYHVSGIPTVFRKFAVTIAPGHEVVIAEMK